MLLSAGCSNPSSGGPDAEGPGARHLQVAGIPTTPPDIDGTITRVVPGRDARPRASSGSLNGSVSCPPDCGSNVTPLQGALIEERPGTTSGDQKSYLTVLKTARLLRRTPTGAVPIAFADLKVGQRAQAWFTGPVLESYPTQTEAGVIVIRDQ